MEGDLGNIIYNPNGQSPKLHQYMKFWDSLIKEQDQCTFDKRKLLIITIKDLMQNGFEYTHYILDIWLYILKQLGDNKEETKLLEPLLVESALMNIKLLTKISPSNTLDSIKDLSYHVMKSYPKEVLIIIGTDHKLQLFSLIASILNKKSYVLSDTPMIKHEFLKIDIMTLDILITIINVLPAKAKTEFMSRGLSVWFSCILPYTISLMTCDKLTSNTKFIEVLKLLTKELAHIDYKTNKDWRKVLECIVDPSKYPAQMKESLNNQSDDWVIIWCVLVKLLKSEITSSKAGTDSPINCLLPIVENAFKMGPWNRCKAFQCWEILAQSFASEKNNQKRILFLMMPLENNNAKVEEVSLAKFKCWWHIIKCFETKLDTFNYTLLIKFLGFCFGQNKSTLAEKFRSSLGVEAFLNVIGHAPDCGGCVKKTIQPMESKILDSATLCGHFSDWLTYIKCATNALANVESFDDAKKQTICIWKSIFGVVATISLDINRNHYTCTLLRKALEIIQENEKTSELIFAAISGTFFSDHEAADKLIGNMNVENVMTGPISVIKDLITHPHIYKFILSDEETSSEKLKPLIKFAFKVESETFVKHLLMKLPCNDQAATIWLAIATYVYENKITTACHGVLLKWPLEKNIKFPNKSSASISWEKLYNYSSTKCNLTHINEELFELLKFYRHTSLFSITVLANIIKFGQHNIDLHQVEMLNTMLKEEIHLADIFPVLTESLILVFKSCNKIDRCPENTIYSLNKVLRSMFEAYNVSNECDKKLLADMMAKLLINVTVSCDIQDYAALLSDTFKLIAESKIIPNIELMTKKIIDSLKIIKFEDENNSSTQQKSFDVDSKSEEIKIVNEKKVEKSKENISDCIIKVITENGENIVIVNSIQKFNPRKLTEHQKEMLQKKRDDIPALYQDLSQSQDEFKKKYWVANKPDTSKSTENSNSSAEVAIETKNTNDKQTTINEKGKLEPKLLSSPRMTPPAVRKQRLPFKDRVMQNMKNLMHKPDNKTTEYENESVGGSNESLTPKKTIDIPSVVINSAPANICIKQRSNRIRKKPRKYELNFTDLTCRKRRNSNTNTNGIKADTKKKKINVDNGNTNVDKVNSKYNNSSENKDNQNNELNINKITKESTQKEEKDGKYVTNATEDEYRSTDQKQCNDIIVHDVLTAASPESNKIEVKIMSTGKKGQKDRPSRLVKSLDDQDLNNKTHVNEITKERDNKSDKKAAEVVNRMTSPKLPTDVMINVTNNNMLTATPSESNKIETATKSTGKKAHKDRQSRLGKSLLNQDLNNKININEITKESADKDDKDTKSDKKSAEVVNKMTSPKLSKLVTNNNMSTATSPERNNIETESKSTGKKAHKDRQTRLVRSLFNQDLNNKTNINKITKESADKEVKKATEVVTKMLAATSPESNKIESESKSAGKKAHKDSQSRLVRSLFNQDLNNKINEITEDSAENEDKNNKSDKKAIENKNQITSPNQCKVVKVTKILTSASPESNKVDSESNSIGKKGQTDKVVTSLVSQDLNINEITKLIGNKEVENDKSEKRPIENENKITNPNQCRNVKVIVTKILPASSPENNKIQTESKSTEKKGQKGKQSRLVASLAIDMVHGNPFLEEPIKSKRTRQTNPDINAKQGGKKTQEINNKELSPSRKPAAKVNGIEKCINVTPITRESSGSNDCSLDLLSEDFIESSQDSTISTLPVRTRRSLKKQKAEADVKSKEDSPSIKIAKSTKDPKNRSSNDISPNNFTATMDTESVTDIQTIELSNTTIHSVTSDITVHEITSEIDTQPIMETHFNSKYSNANDVTAELDTQSMVETVSSVIVKSNSKQTQSQLTSSLDTEPLSENDIHIIANNDEIIVMDQDSSVQTPIGIETQEIAEADTEPVDISRLCNINKNNTLTISSPVKDSSQRISMLVNNTLDISPIQINEREIETTPEKTEEFVVIRLSTPVQSNGEPIEECHSPELFTNEKVSPSKLELSPIKGNIPTEKSSLLSSKKPRSQVRVTGRAAQMLSLCQPDKLQSIYNNEKHIIDNETTKKVNHIIPVRRNLHILYNNNPTNYGNESSDSSSNEKLNNFLKLNSRPLPSSNSSPIGPILKRKLDLDDDINVSPASKKKRVSFHDPPVSTTVAVQKYIETNVERSPQTSLSKRNDRPQRNNLKPPRQIESSFKPLVKVNISSTLDADMSSLDETPSVEVVNISELNDTEPICSDLVNCNDSIDVIATELSSPAMKSLLIKELEGKIDTIGDFAKLTEVEVNRLCIQAPKVQIAKKTLADYLAKNQHKTELIRPIENVELHVFDEFEKQGLELSPLFVEIGTKTDDNILTDVSLQADDKIPTHMTVHTEDKITEMTLQTDDKIPTDITVETDDNMLTDMTVQNNDTILTEMTVQSNDTILTDMTVQSHDSGPQEEDVTEEVPDLAKVLPKVKKTLYELDLLLYHIYESYDSIDLVAFSAKLLTLTKNKMNN